MDSSGVSITFRVLHTFLQDSSATGVLCTGAGKGNCYALSDLMEQKSSYFPVLIAVLKNNLLLRGSCCGKLGAVPMSDVPHKSERVSGLEAWALALATALIALIAVGVVPHVHW